VTAEQICHARDLLTRPDITVSSIARLLGVSRATIYTLGSPWGRRSPADAAANMTQSGVPGEQLQVLRSQFSTARTIGLASSQE
jgi:hypothetical protein